MKLKVKHKCVTIRGEVKNFTKTYTCPEFEDIEREITNKDLAKALKTDVTVETRHDQELDWLDNQDKWDWMVEMDIQTILDYEIVPIKTKALVKLEKEGKKKDDLALIKYAFSLCFKDKEQMKIDAVAVYAEMYDTINTLSIEKQLMIVIKSMGIGYQASGEAYRYMVELMNSDSVKEMEAKIEANRGDYGLKIDK